MKINFSPPDITQLEIDQVVDTLKSGWITTGPKTKKLEEILSKKIGTESTVCLNSATAGLELILRFLGIGPGDEVITCAYTYTASASIINHVGAKIVLADCQKDNPIIDYDDLENRITENTKAIIPVDLAGVMVDYKKIYEIIERKKSIFKGNSKVQNLFNRIVIIADAAHSLGAIRDGINSGNYADFTAFSFHAVKNFTTAEGGAITWKNKEGIDNIEVYNQFMLLALHGQSKDALSKMKPGAWEYDIVCTGYKMNMTDINAALGLAQIERYPDLLKRRKKIIETYNEGFLKDKSIIPLVHYGDNFSGSGHLYIVNLIDFTESMRNRLIEKMAEKEIATNVHYKPLPMMTAYKNLGFNIKDYPNSFKMYENEITLPLHTLLTNEDVKYVIDTFLVCINEVRKEYSGN